MGPVLRLAIACAALIALCAAPVAAHDFWIQPSNFRPALDERVGVALLFGELWQGEEVPRNPERILGFRSFDAGGAHDVVGVDMQSPAGFLRPREAGTVLVAYHCTPNSIALPAEKFESYLRDEGLERVIEARRAAGERGDAARELYQRCAKSLLVAGQPESSPEGPGGPGWAGGAIWERRAGLPLELSPLADPSACAAERVLPLELTFRAQPLEGAQVVAFERSSPAATRVAGRTDRDGRVRLALPVVPGPQAPALEQWLVKSVHMERASDRAQADWESWWASLTFAAEAPRGGVR
jgi:hypothetical protein